MIETEAPKDPVIAICRDELAFHSLMSQRGMSHANLVIVSDDLAVHKLVQKHKKLQVVFLDGMESFFEVAEHVLTILEAVNYWLKEQGDNLYLPKSLLYWIHHVEGGDTTQRIQDAVLEARSCFSLLDRFHPRKVILCSGDKACWEDLVWIECAKQRTITIQKLGRRSFGNIISGLWERLRPFAKEVYRSFSTIDAMLRRKASKYGSGGYGKYVAIQLCSDAPKHLNHTIPLLDALEREGLKAVAVTCDIGRYAKSLRKQRYEVAELEAWVPVVSLFRSWLAVFAGLVRSRKNISSFLPSGSGGEYAPFIRPVLLHSLQSFFLAEVPYRIRLSSACEAFFSCNPPVAARLWTRTLFQSAVAYQSMSCKPVLFWQPGWPYQYSRPCYKYLVPVDLIFCLSSAHLKVFEKDHSEQKKYVVGVPWLNKVKTYCAENSKQRSRLILNIPSESKFVIFLDALVVMRGYNSSKEQFFLVETVVSFAERHSDVCLLVKPHTGHKPGKLDAYFASRASNRIIWVPRDILPFDCINAADVLVTKCSTMAAEAMFFDVPSICMLPEKEVRRKVYEDAVEHVADTEELRLKLEALLDKGYYSSWQKSLRVRQLEFMKQHLPEPEVECSSFIASKVKEAILEIR